MPDDDPLQEAQRHPREARRNLRERRQPIIKHVRNHPGAKIPEIAEAMDKDPSTIRDQTDWLHREGILAMRRRDRNGQRLYFLPDHAPTPFHPGDYNAPEGVPLQICWLLTALCDPTIRRNRQGPRSIGDVAGLGRGVAKRYEDWVAENVTYHIGPTFLDREGVAIPSKHLVRDVITWAHNVNSNPGPVSIPWRENGTPFP